MRSSRSSSPSFRPVNNLLGSRPTIGPIPADLFIPFGAISLFVGLISSQLLRLSIDWTIALIIWGCATWWILTGSRPYRFLSKFMPVPQRWSRGHVRYCSIRQARRQQVQRQKARKQQQAHKQYSQRGSR